MEIINSNDFMSFDEKDKFWKMLFEKISKAVMSNHRFTVVFGLNEIVGGDYKDADDYTLVVDADQYVIFLTNYIKWCEELERFEECQKALHVLNVFNTKNSKKN